MEAEELLFSLCEISEVRKVCVLRGRGNCPGVHLPLLCTILEFHHY